MSSESLRFQYTSSPAVETAPAPLRRSHTPSQSSTGTRARRCRSAFGSLLTDSLVFDSHRASATPVAAPEFGAKTVGRADKFARVAVTPAWGRVGAFRRSLTAQNTGLFLLRVSCYGGVR